MSVVLSKCQPGVDDSSLPWPTATAETFTAMPTRHAARMCILSPPIEGPSKCQTGDDYLSLRRPFCSNAWPSSLRPSVLSAVWSHVLLLSQLPRTEEAWCFVSTLELLARDDEAIHQPRDSIICRGMNGNQRRSRLL
ncbi:unnamed protein product [Gadus morhua 'NCC']